MPFTEKGITPDLIINPNAIPSRMTIGQLIECLLGKVGAIRGHECDGTAFTRVDIESIKNELEKLGYERNGSEYMYNGMTGVKMQSMIFVGPTYYQRLKHLVKDKVHCEKIDGLEVLTFAGWKTAKQITMDDMIATLKNGELVYDKPTKIYMYPDYEGIMYHVETRMIDEYVTGGHRMWVSKRRDDGDIWDEYNFEYAKDIVGKQRRYMKVAKWNVPDYDMPIPLNSGHCNALPPNIDKWMEFFGICLMNGCILKSRGHLEVRNCNEYMNDILSTIGYDYYTMEEYHSVIIDDAPLCVIMETYGVDTDEHRNEQKHMPDWVWKLSQRQTRKLLKGVVFTQCDMMKQFSSTSKDLINDVMRLCIHCGWTCGEVTENIGGHNIYVVNINTRAEICEVNGKQHTVETFKVEKCPVFCLEVPSGVFYVRRNGKCVWTGNSRARGPRTLLLHQPSEGRARGGGMRIGEMERDALIAHGVAKYIKEKLMDTSDMYTTYVCDKCGLFAQRFNKSENKVYSTENDAYYCPSCRNKTNISKIVIPYAFKLLVQELMSMCIAPRIHTVNDKYTC